MWMVITHYFSNSFGTFSIFFIICIFTFIHSIKYSSLNKGYTLKKITVTTYNKAGKEVVKTMKNNSTLKLGEYAYAMQKGKCPGPMHPLAGYWKTQATLAQNTIRSS